MSPITRQQILDSSKLKEFADDNFKFDENGLKLSKQYKNVGKGEIACNEQFLLVPQCFQKSCFPGASKGVIVWEWVNKDTYFVSIVVVSISAVLMVPVKLNGNVSLNADLPI